MKTISSQIGIDKMQTAIDTLKSHGVKVVVAACTSMV